MKMDVTKCEECGYEISIKTDRCPNCGERIGVNIGGALKFVRRLIFLLMTLYIVYTVFKFLDK